MPKLAGSARGHRIVGSADVRFRLRRNRVDLQRGRHGSRKSKVYDVFVALLARGGPGSGRTPLPQLVQPLGGSPHWAPDPVLTFRRHECHLFHVPFPGASGAFSESFPPPAPALLQHFPVAVTLPRVRKPAALGVLPQPPFSLPRAAPLG